MFREDVRKEMTRAWQKEFYTLQKDVQFQREGGFDPVLETGSVLLDEPVRGVFRKVEKELQDNVNIINTDFKFTVLQESLVKTLDQSLIVPEENDIISYNGKKWRVITIKEDSANIFWHLIVRGI